MNSSEEKKPLKEQERKVLKFLRKNTIRDGVSTALRGMRGMKGMKGMRGMRGMRGMKG